MSERPPGPARGERHHLRCPPTEPPPPAARRVGPRRGGHTRGPPPGRPAPGPVRRLTRRTDNKMIAGVASGIAAYLGIEPWIVRIASSSWSPSGASACWPT